MTMVVEEEKWGVIFCPKTNRFVGDKKREKIKKILTSQQINYELVQADGTDKIEYLTKKFINNNYHTIVVVGGDSALHDVVNTFMQFEQSIIQQISLGVIPHGVMNDFSLFWGIKEGEDEKIIKALKKKRIRSIDVGKILYTNKDGKQCRRYFLNCVNIGFIASIMNLKHQTRALLYDRTLSFIVSFILLIFQRLSYKVHLKINNEEIKQRIMTICIGNSLGYGQTPSAVPYNGLLDVTLVRLPGLLQLFEGIYLFIKGEFLNHKYVLPYRTRKVEVLSLGGAMISVDGKFMSQRLEQLEIIIEPERINFIIPT